MRFIRITSGHTVLFEKSVLSEVHKTNLHENDIREVYEKIFWLFSEPCKVSISFLSCDWFLRQRVLIE